MKVIYFINDPAGHPSAAFNRIKLFQKGFIQNNVDCKIIKLINVNNKLICKIKAASQMLAIYFRYFMSEKYTLIIYGENFLWTLLALPRKCKVLVERNEYPNFMITEGWASDSSCLLKLKNIDGFITCSKALNDFYKQYLPTDCPIHISRIIVDTRAFSIRPPVEKKITYCGDWGNNKDGVDILISAFSIFHKQYSDFKLELIGGSTPMIEKRLKDLTVELGISNSVLFVGRVAHEDMPKYLCSAYMLALARPNNKQAEGGVPSKVAEYLSTGRPVVMTKVGELGSLLNDGVDCFLSVPDSVELFASKLVEVVNSERLTVITENAKKIAAEYNYDCQSESLRKFLQRM